MDPTEILTDANAYCKVLAHTFGLQASFHYADLPTTLYTALHFNRHDNPYCDCVKKTGLRHCCLCKGLAMQTLGNAPKVGTCYAGVRELLFPVILDAKPVTFISVSGYRAQTEPDFDRLSRAVGQSATTLKAEYARLKPDAPSIETVAPLIKPLVYILKALFALPLSVSADPREQTFRNIVRYLNENFRADIRIDDVCRYTGCSESYVYHLFQRYADTTPTAYLTDLRLKTAAEQLTATDAKILDIAYAVGYNDSNYFTHLFTTRYGLSPREYRKKTKITTAESGAENRNRRRRDEGA